MNSRHLVICSQALKLIDNNILLSGLKSSPRDRDWIIINSYSEAKTLARQQYSVDNPWLDLRSGLAAKIDDSQFDWDMMDSLLGKKLYDYISNAGLIDYVGGDVEGDLINICKDFGNPSLFHDFWSSTWNAYELGGWPCGWLGGEFPEGKLAVFDARDWGNTLNTQIIKK